jgi:hypothetical protein
MLLVIHCYGAVRGFWPVEELVELVDEQTGCGDVMWGGRLLAWNFGVTRLAVLMEVERKARPNMTLPLC